jgi:hypothetical protein
MRQQISSSCVLSTFYFTPRHPHRSIASSQISLTFYETHTKRRACGPSGRHDFFVTLRPFVSPTSFFYFIHHIVSKLITLYFVHALPFLSPRLTSSLTRNQTLSFFGYAEPVHLVVDTTLADNKMAVRGFSRRLLNVGEHQLVSAFYEVGVKTTMTEVETTCIYHMINGQVVYASKSLYFPCYVLLSYPCLSFVDATVICQTRHLRAFSHRAYL